MASWAEQPGEFTDLRCRELIEIHMMGRRYFKGRNNLLTIGAGVLITLLVIFIITPILGLFRGSRRLVSL